MLRQGGAVAGVRAAGEQATVHLGVEGLHAAVHHLGEARHTFNGDHREACLAERLGCAAGRDDLPAERGQLAGELDDAALVRNRQQRSHQLSAMARTRSARLATSFRSITSTGEWE